MRSDDPAPADPEGARFDIDVERLRRITEMPLANLRFSLWWIRKTFFSRPRSRGDYLVVPLSKTELKELFGRNFFEPGWETFYQYRNEILNVRRVEYDDEHAPPIEWWQVHIRGYRHEPTRAEDPGEVQLTSHFEPEPVEYPDAHVGKDYIDLDRGMDVLRGLLDDHDVDYEYVTAGSW